LRWSDLRPLASLSAIALTLGASRDVETIQQVKSWGYQLQAREGAHLDIGALSASPFDLLVIDYADGERPLTSREVERVRERRGAGRRVVLAYLSVGEAEDYRFYWKPEWRDHPPSFLARANPDWKGNYKVRFWDPAWRAMIDEYVTQIIEAGFDGVYLDIIDAFEFFSPGGEMPERPSAAQDMRTFVIDLAAFAREKKKKPDFMVVPQNGANILDGLDDDAAKPYLDAIDAIGVEDTFFTSERRRIQRDVLRRLERFQRAGKPVLAVDYLKSAEKAREFVRLAKKHGFVPYVGARELDRLVRQPN
jgi:cysteinyl-tRNA synthetase, unknown class